jgi:hypothetical protein
VTAPFVHWSAAVVHSTLFRCSSNQAAIHVTNWQRSASKHPPNRDRFLRTCRRCHMGIVDVSCMIILLKFCPSVRFVHITIVPIKMKRQLFKSGDRVGLNPNLGHVHSRLHLMHDTTDRCMYLCIILHKIQTPFFFFSQSIGEGWQN